MMAEMVLGTCQNDEEEENEEEEGDGEGRELQQKEVSSQSARVVSKTTLLDDDETPMAVFARFASADPVDEDVEDSLVTEKIRLLQEENVRLRQTLGKTVGKDSPEKGQQAPTVGPKDDDSLGLVADWLVGSAKASEEREKAHAEAAHAAIQERKRDRAMSAARQHLANERAERARLLSELDKWVESSKGRRGALKRGSINGV